MVAYYLLISYWTFTHISIISFFKQNKRINWKLFESLILGLSLFLVMALRNESVGVDTNQYLFRYNYYIYPLDLTIFSYDEWGFHGFAAILSYFNIPDQMYLAIISLIIVVLFTRFYYKYSTDIFYSYFLHLTIGVFALSLSGLSQIIAVGIFLKGFDYIVYNKPIKYVLSILLAATIHNSAIFLLPLYLFRNLRLNKKSGFVLLFSVISVLFFVNPILNFSVRFLPTHYANYILKGGNNMNPLVIAVAISIPLFYLIFSRKTCEGNDYSNKIYSLFFIMSIFNALFNILSINLSIISRISYYFLPFNMILIPITVKGIKDKGIKYLVLVIISILCLLQFIISTPGGILQIDNYRFFWQ